MNTKAIRECAASHVYWTERANETPSALIRWTIPGLCDRVDELEERLRAVEALHSPTYPAGGGRQVQATRVCAADGEIYPCPTAAALAPATSPAEQEGDRCPECGVLNDGEHDPADAFGPAPDWNHPDRCPQCHMFPTGGYRAVQAKRAEQEPCGRSVHSYAIGGSAPCARPAGHDGDHAMGFIVHEVGTTPKDPPDTSWVTEVPGS